MIKKLFSSQAMIAICLLAIFSIPLFPQDSHISEAEAWTMISSYLDCFLADPIANISLLERVDDLQYWTSIYSQLKEKSFLKEVFSKHFPVSDMDEAKLDVIFRLLKACSSPTSYEYLKPIISRLIEISSIKPEWFARNLLLRDDWRQITRLIVKADIENILGQRKGLRDVLSDLGDHEVKKELINLFNELDNENQNEFGRFEEFMKDPAENLDKIKDIYNLCSTMGRHDDLNLDENKTLWPKDNSILILQDWIRNDTDERKIKVLFHLMNRCDSAYHREVIIGIATNVFIGYHQLFVSTLKDEPNWRRIMLDMIYGLYDRDKEFKRSISTLGKSDFEMKIRSQLEFLRDNLNYEY